MDGGVWWATVHGVAKSWIRLSNFMEDRKGLTHLGGSYWGGVGCRTWNKSKTNPDHNSSTASTATHHLQRVKGERNEKTREEALKA